MLPVFFIISVAVCMLLQAPYLKAELISLGTDEAPSWFQKFEIENNFRFSELKTEFRTAHSELQSHIDMRFEQLHDDNRDKIISLQKASRSSEICGSAITSHFVLYKSYVFAISVAHTPCYMGDILPEWFHVCPQLDVSIWSGCPPANVALLNITSSVVDAEMGDAATAFGFSFGNPRAWHGTIVGLLGKNSTGKHLTPNAFESDQELLFQGAQQQGMSGGGVLNGRGYLGVARAIFSDSLNKNHLPTVVPFNLFHDCIEDLFPKLKRWSPSGHVADCPHEYEIIESVQTTVVKKSTGSCSGL